MGSAVLGRSQLARLFQIYLAVSGDRPPNARELSERCEVSRRTIYRDLETLMMAGVPIEFRADLRGYRIARGTSTAPPRLGFNEIRALLVLVESWAGTDTLGLLPAARAGLEALLKPLSPEARDAAAALQRQIGEPSRTPSRTAARVAVDETILAALRHGSTLELELVSTEQTVIVRPRRLVNYAESWSLISMRVDSEQIQSIAVDEILRATLVDEDSDHAMHESSSPRGNRSSVRVVVRVASETSASFRSRFPWPLATLPSPLEYEELTFEVASLDEGAAGLIGFADSVEVLEPPALRECLRDIGERLTRRYARTAANPDTEFSVRCGGGLTLGDDRLESYSPR